MASLCWVRPPHCAADCADGGRHERRTRAVDVDTLRSAIGTLASPQPATGAYADVAVSFIEDRGQTDARVRYFAQGSGYSFFMVRWKY